MILPITSAIIIVTVLAVVTLSIICIRLNLLLRKAEADRNELIAANKNIEAAVKAKSEFLAAMGQEIQAPASALASFTEVLIQRSLQNCSAELKEETEGIGNIIKKNSHDLNSIVNDVFDYIKIDANLLEIESVPMSIKQVIHDICHLERPNALAKHLDLCIKYSGEIPSTILCDPVRIRQILSNLIGHAIKSTEKGTITVLCEILEGGDPASAETDSADQTKETAIKKLPNSFSASLVQLKISVMDPGGGISPSHIQKLSDPFKHGVSLRLNIAMRLATLLDGTIHVRSAPGRGSIFSLLLNAYVPEGTPPMLHKRKNRGGTSHELRLHAKFGIRVPTKKSDDLSADESRPLRGIRVLVVEDMAVNQVIVATLLRDAGAQVELADDGEKGVQKVMQDMDNGLVFDVILMDMRMPVMDGYEATSHLRKLNYNRPIIAVTAHVHEDDLEKIFQAGCDGYLAKPVDGETLINIIKKHVNVLSRKG